ncbi:MAG: FG-GAP repeat protein, partial [Actinomycetales bacterium]
MKFIGNRLAMGFIEDESIGAVRILEPTASGWQFAATPISAPNPDCREFGLSLAVDGTRVAVGSSSGHVFVIETATPTPTLIASWRASPAGYALVHSLAGDDLLVGLPASNGGQGGGALLRINGNEMVVSQLLIPERPAGRLGWSGGISGDGIVLSSEDYWGNWHAMTWRRQSGNTWVFDTELLPVNPAGNSIFGCSSSIEGDVIAVGARDDSAAGPASGACYVFERLGGQWVQAAKLTITEPPFGNQETGANVAVRDGRIWFSSA